MQGFPAEEYENVPQDLATIYDNVQPEADSSDSDITDQEDLDDLERRVLQELCRNVKHKGPKIPRHQDPFTHPEMHEILDNTLQQVAELNFLPESYGMQPEEWEDDEYPQSEIIVGRRKKEAIIQLPLGIWYSQAVRWTRALYIMNELLYSLE
ncbi:hypothetical protein M422DRAFT_55199 [Sphaerobolus stellatus SS14]|uniref:Uncharacterized protein n=1 Tax=Sphaerobolus stellatus (strain SS14) TaxID=990650 RepID=A0A0C9UDB0_SPHS4|nr:hypothetical protein M422DRAFT_55199 [Sphaerobolus stellatus SS14]